jgi:hypothetical protein
MAAARLETAHDCAYVLPRAQRLDDLAATQISGANSLRSIGARAYARVIEGSLPDVELTPESGGIA